MTTYKKAKKMYYDECRDELLADGFFYKKESESWYKIDFQAQIFITLMCGKSGQIMQASPYAHSLLSEIYINLILDKSDSGADALSHFEKLFADTTPGYVKMRDATLEYHLPWEVQVKFMTEFTKKLVLPAYRKIKSLRDYYDFLIFISKKTGYKNETPEFFLLSTYFNDWDGALSIVEFEEENNEDYLQSNKERFYIKHYIGEKEFQGHVNNYKVSSTYITEKKAAVLSKDKNYFEKIYEANYNNAIANFKECFAEEIEKGIISIPVHCK